MAARCSHPASVLLVAALSLAFAAPVLAAKGKDKDKKGPGGGSSKPDPAPKKSKVTEPVQGQYHVRVAGYFTGTGTASASAEGIKISARVKDPAGNTFDFQAKNLSVTDDRFTGTGSVGGVGVQIDGRLDPRDDKGEVLKKGRLTFTFSANGHHSRGVGQQR